MAWIRSRVAWTAKNKAREELPELEAGAEGTEEEGARSMQQDLGQHERGAGCECALALQQAEAGDSTAEPELRFKPPPLESDATICPHTSAKLARRVQIHFISKVGRCEWEGASKHHFPASLVKYFAGSASKSFRQLLQHSLISCP